MKRNISIFLIGFIIGMLLMSGIVWNTMPKMMLKVKKSKLTFEETVTAITGAADQKGWKVPKVYDIQKSLQEAGYEDMLPLKIISLCKPEHAYHVLSQDENKKVSGIMPCRMSVFQDSNGKVYVAEMNIGLMSRIFGGTIEKVMGEVAKEEKQMLQNIIQE